LSGCINKKKEKRKARCPVTAKGPLPIGCKKACCFVTAKKHVAQWHQRARRTEVAKKLAGLWLQESPGGSKKLAFEWLQKCLLLRGRKNPTG
jgi:hypothetical protein